MAYVTVGLMSYKSLINVSIGLWFQWKERSSVFTMTMARHNAVSHLCLYKSNERHETLQCLSQFYTRLLTENGGFKKTRKLSCGERDLVGSRGCVFMLASGDYNTIITLFRSTLRRALESIQKTSAWRQSCGERDLVLSRGCVFMLATGDYNTIIALFRSTTPHWGEPWSP